VEAFLRGLRSCELFVLAIGLLVADLVKPHSVLLLALWGRSAVRN